MQSQEIFTGVKSAELFVDFFKANYSTGVKRKGNAVYFETENIELRCAFIVAALAFRFAAGNAVDLVAEME